jgi:peptide subunit release factor 1 (eRF1)
VQQDYLAVAGFQDTLLQLQEGKLDTLVMARTAERTGTQCLRCGVYLVAPDGACNYCGGKIEEGIDLVEAMIRLAAEQEVDITFGDASTMSDFDGTGGLLRFQ